MSDNRFQWDAAKAATNARDHGVDFVSAVKAFRDPFGIEWIDSRQDYGEERVNLLGMCDDVLLHVTYTERGDGIRIISARKATRHEQDHYHRENAR